VNTSPVEPLRRRSFGRLFIAAVIVGAGIAFASHVSEGREFLALARRAHPAWLIAALAAQLLTYASEAVIWRSTLARGGFIRPLVELCELAIVALFTNQAVPTAGLGGMVLVIRALELRGVRHDVAVSVILVDLIAYYTAYGLSVAFALLVLRDHLSVAILVAAGALGVLALAIAGGALWIVGAGRSLPALLARIPPLASAVGSLSSADRAIVRDPALLGLAVVLRSLSMGLDIATLAFCLRAVGEITPPGPIIAAYVLGSLARTLGIVPGGLGTFEAATVAGLALFGTSVEAALTATLLFRGLSFWLPMLPGFWFGRRFALVDSGGHPVPDPLARTSS
jgi:uncharacterized membrane protein YbhN (UPF0104 family)